MYKNIAISVLIIALGLLIYFSMKNKPDIRQFEKKIDSLNIVIKNKRKNIEKFKGQAEYFSKSQNEYTKIADSLALYIENHPELECPDELHVSNREIIALRTALQECDRAKVIYVKTVGVCEEINMNFEQIVFNKDEIINATEKQLRRQLFKGIGIGAAIVGGIVIIASFL